jgi:hypothetical protein
MADTIDPRWAWEPYKPSDKSPWDVKKVGHLYRRVAFGATLAGLEAGLKAGPEKAIDDLFKGHSDREGPGEDRWLADRLSEVNNGQGIQAWWLRRLLVTPDPLREKLTLFWHNHFATSNAKVQSARFMLGQYELMRRHALGNFRTLLQEMSKDLAMMVWLDTNTSKKGMPNENYARELMELFSLGIGNYTEKDIREAARAFTGYEIKGTESIFNAAQHDATEKTVLGKSGKFKAEDVVDICLEQKSCPSFLAGKLFRFLVSETIKPTPELLQPLAAQLREDNYDCGALVKTVLRSNLFFSPLAYRSRVKAPVDFAVGIVRALEGRVGTTGLAQALEQLGQSLFYPPSVKGWDGGQAWLNGQTLLFRQNLALALTSTEDRRFASRGKDGKISPDPAELARRHGKKDDAELVDFFLRLFLQGDVPAASREKLLAYMQRSHKQTVPVYWTEADAADHRVRTLCHLVLTLPEFQLD